MRITFVFHLRDSEQLFTKAAFGWKAKYCKLKEKVEEREPGRNQQY